jgi:hypothetical protein
VSASLAIAMPSVIEWLYIAGFIGFFVGVFWIVRAIKASNRKNPPDR